MKLFFMVIAILSFGCSSSQNNATDGDLDNELDVAEQIELEQTEFEQIESDLEKDAIDSEIADTEKELEQVTYPACGSGDYKGNSLIPGTREAGFDAELAALARKYDRQYHQFNGLPAGVMTDLAINGTTKIATNLANDDAEVSYEGQAEVLKRDVVEDWLTNSDSWDFEAYSGFDPLLMIDAVYKVAGLYGGSGASADAMRYAVLRDQGAACAEIEQAKERLLLAISAIHMAHTISGRPGSVARGFARTDLPGWPSTTELIPLEDEHGNALPLEKTNGEWREDFSGQYPNFIWEDSCSRDMLLGWAMASAICMEVIKNDPSFSDDVKNTLKEDARIVGLGLRTVQESGYDLELIDADGRTTFHGYLNEQAVESSVYVPGFENGFYALMTLGIVGAYAYTSNDADAWKYLNEELIEKRKLPEIARDHMLYMNMDKASNFSNYNMGFFSAWLALRYIENQDARDKLIESVELALYDSPGKNYQPVDTKMTMYDFVYAFSKLNGSAFSLPNGQVDETALANGLSTLKGYDTPPYWDHYVENCDEDELNSGDCILNDGTAVKVYFEGGRKGSTVCDTPVPKAIRRPSNFEWRSNPYNPNGGGDGGSLLSGVSFRVAYWMGRFIKVPAK